MTFKTILVSMNDISRNGVLLAAVGDLARDFDAHIIGHYVVPAVELYGTDGLMAMPFVFEGRRDHFREAASAVKQDFETALAKAGLHGYFEQVTAATPDVTSVLVEHARRADLVVVSQGDSADTTMLERDFVERTILSTGRPTLVIPRKGKADLQGETAILGWNNTRESARAAFDSVTLLRRVREVRVTWVDPEAEYESAGPLPGAEIAECLSRHRINTVVEPLSTGGVRGAGEALLLKANDEGAAFVVMGAYGHSRLREFILGGATRSVLDQMTCPVLFSH
jgi:nucleotide-binding universal stress UspA family protein